MLKIWLLLIIFISRWIMVRNKAVFCLEVVIYKRLQIWRHNYVISRNEYVIFTFSESTIPWIYSLQFLFKSTHHSWRYERKCEWVFFFWTQCTSLSMPRLQQRWLRWHQTILHLLDTAFNYDACLDLWTLPCYIYCTSVTIKAQCWIHYSLQSTHVTQTCLM